MPSAADLLAPMNHGLAEAFRCILSGRGLKPVADLRAF